MKFNLLEHIRMSVEAIEDSIIKLFKEVNEPFYTKFIEPLRDNNNLTNVIGIFLFNNKEFDKGRLTGFLKGVVQKLNGELFEIFKDSMKKLKEGVILFVKSDGKTNTVNPSVLYEDNVPPFVLTGKGKKMESAKALKYTEINQIVLDREGQLENERIARERRENAFLKLKKNIDKFSDELFPQLISDDEEGVGVRQVVVDGVAFRDCSHVLDGIDVVVGGCGAETGLHQALGHEHQVRRDNQATRTGRNQQTAFIEEVSNLNDCVFQRGLVEVSRHSRAVAVGTAGHQRVSSAEQGSAVT
jgi:hypothetical protein